MTVMARPVNHKEVENNISCVDLSVANVLCWPLFMVTGRRGEKKNLRVFKFSVQETRLEKKCRLSDGPISKFFFAERLQLKGGIG